MTSKSFLFVLLIIISLHTTGNAQMPNITDPRYDIKLPTPAGDSLVLSSLKGKVVLLDFWASWCMPCRAANKQLVKIYPKYKEQGFEIFSVSMDEDKKAWMKAIAKDKINWLQVNDPRGGWEAETAHNWNITQLPTSLLINKKGDVVAFDLSSKDLDKKIRDLLKE